MTEFEAQVFALKRAHAGAILLVEKGHKYEISGADAVVAAAALRSLRPVRRPHFFAAALSFPGPRVGFYARRLVGAGFRVAVVRQSETRATHDAGAKRGAVFARALAGLYSRGTLVDDDVIVIFGE